MRREVLSKNMKMKNEADYYFQELLKVRKLLQSTDDELMAMFDEKDRRKRIKKAKQYKEMMDRTSR